jgi:hypothetical protein
MSNTPPRWAQSLLQTILDERDRETVSGDLLEEYIEVRLPARGSRRASLWYLRQVLSLLTWRGVCRLAMDGSWSSAILWAAAAALVEFVFVFVLPDTFGASIESSVFMLIACALAASGVTAFRSVSFASARYWGSLTFVVIVSASMLPISLLGFFALSLALIFIAAGFYGAWHGGLVRTGTLLAMMTSAIAILLVQAAGALSAALGGASELHPPMPNLLMLCPISLVFGTLGAFASKGLTAILRNHGFR